MALIKTLHVDQGADFFLAIEISYDEGDLVDLEGYILESQIRKTYSSNTFYSFETSIEDNICNFTLSANTSASMEPGKYVYDCLLTDPDNIKTRIMEGSIIISPQVTKE